MRHVVAGMAALLLSSGMVMARECPEGSQEPMRLLSWTAKQEATLLGSATHISVEVENTTGVDIRMLNASIFFDDVLGAHIGGWFLPKDELIAADTTATLAFTSFGATRLSQAQPADILAIVCTKSAITGSGEQLDF